jgi:hypothetical protein
MINVVGEKWRRSQRVVAQSSSLLNLISNLNRRLFLPGTVAALASPIRRGDCSMSEKTTKTKAELFEMLAQAVRNTQPQPIVAPQPDLTSDGQPEPPHKKRSVPKRARKAKTSRASASRKQRRR